jgi:beta-galactosidase
MKMRLIAPRRRTASRHLAVCWLVLATASCSSICCFAQQAASNPPRQDPSQGPRWRLLIDDDWRFNKGDPPDNAVSLLYDVRPAGGGPAGGGRGATVPAPTQAQAAKAWILPSGNAFLKDASKAAQRPAGNLGEGVAYIAAGFDDGGWRKLNLPHDYAIEGPFTNSVSGGMGRLPSPGVAWYRKNLNIPAADAGKSIFLDFDGAMSYSEVWLNGQFVGGWPFGYASFRLNLTPYARPGGKNVLAVRLDNPPNSSRWYPGGGLYRNVWLVKTSPVHVGQWGTYVTTPLVAQFAATVALQVKVDNDGRQDATVSVGTQIFELDGEDRKVGAAVATIAPATLQLAAGKNVTANTEVIIPNPKLWGTGAHQKPNRYVAVTTVQQGGATIDTYETAFGVRTLKFDANEGFFLNGERIKLKGVCNHHDLGALGAAFNYRAAQRQLEMLAEMGCNAIRTSHNPPAPELLDLCDKMGFLVMDESFDCWKNQKTPNDYHLLYPDWHEQDLRAMLRRDRNHPSVIMWSIGNEVGEQSGDPTGIAKELTEICHQEDATRPTVSGMNAARANSSFTAPIDAIGLNYQGAGLNPVKRPPGTPQYPLYHEAYPGKFIVGAETASTVSSRGFYAFPVAEGLGIAAAANAGEMPGVRQVSSYDLYHADWSYVPDKEFAAQERWPFVGGEFVWTGFDYLGEPTPFDASRSSYFGIIDLAGFKKDRFYLYQSVWRPELPMAHILPHWNWPERAGQVTPVHVYTSGDEAELLLNGKSLGRKKKAPFEYRLRWDDVVYAPGELRVVAYKNGKEWAADSVKTAGAAAKLLLTPDRAAIAGDGKDLSFVTLTVADQNGRMVPRSMNPIHFAISGPGEIVATDNGDPTDMTAFPSQDRKAFNGLALAIVRAQRGQTGRIVVTAKSDGLADAQIGILAQ